VLLLDVFEEAADVLVTGFNVAVFEQEKLLELVGEFGEGEVVEVLGAGGIGVDDGGVHGGEKVG